MESDPLSPDLKSSEKWLTDSVHLFAQLLINTFCYPWGLRHQCFVVWIFLPPGSARRVQETKLEVPPLSQLYQALLEACESSNGDTFEASTCLFTGLQEESCLTGRDDPGEHSKGYLSSFSEFFLSSSSASHTLRQDFGLELVQLLLPHVDHHKDDVCQVCFFHSFSFARFYKPCVLWCRQGN